VNKTSDAGALRGAHGRRGWPRPSLGRAGKTTLDDQTVLEAARSDPAGFIRGLERATIDEIRRAPDPLLAAKKMSMRTIAPVDFCAPARRSSTRRSQCAGPSPLSDPHRRDLAAVKSGNHGAFFYRFKFEQLWNTLCRHQGNPREPGNPLLQMNYLRFRPPMPASRLRNLGQLPAVGSSAVSLSSFSCAGGFDTDEISVPNSMSTKAMFCA
jgi:hypothetical protein